MALNDMHQISNNLSLKSPSNTELIGNINSNNEYDTSQIEKNFKLAWVGDYSSIKSMVAEFLKLDGEWQQPGGEKKIFYCGNTPVLTWWSKKKTLHLDGVNSRTLILKLLSTSVLRKESDDIVNNINSRPCYSCCHCNEMSTDMEGIKLDMAIVESKLDKSIIHNSQEINEMKSAVNEMGCRLESFNSLLGRINGENSASDVNNKTPHELSRLGGERVSPQEVSRVGNGQPCDTVSQHVVTYELGKRSVESNVGASSREELSESVVEVVTANANENMIQNLTIQTIESDDLNEPNGQLDNGLSRASYNTNVQPGFEEQIQQYKQYHKKNLCREKQRQTYICDTDTEIKYRKTMANRCDAHLNDYRVKHGHESQKINSNRQSAAISNTRGSFPPREPSRARRRRWKNSQKNRGNRGENFYTVSERRRPPDWLNYLLYVQNITTTRRPQLSNL